MGWTIIPPAQAFADPFYQQQPDRQVPGQSLMLSVMRSKGINRWPGWERLVDDGDYEIDVIKAAGQ